MMSAWLLGAVIVVSGGVTQAVPSGPLSHVAIQGTRLCIQAQTGQVDLRGQDRAQVKVMALPSETGPGGVFLTLGPTGCDVLVGTDGTAAREGVKDWLSRDGGGYRWVSVPTLGIPGQGERGDRAAYYVTEDYRASLALADTRNDMTRVVVLPPMDPDMLRLRVETAIRGHERDAGQAVFDAVERLCTGLAVAARRRSARDSHELEANFFVYTGTGGTLLHGGPVEDVVTVQAEAERCLVGAHGGDAAKVGEWLEKLTRAMVNAGWYHDGEDVLRVNDGRVARLFQQGQDLLVEIDLP